MSLSERLCYLTIARNRLSLWGIKNAKNKKITVAKRADLLDFAHDLPWPAYFDPSGRYLYSFTIRWADSLDRLRALDPQRAK